MAVRRKTVMIVAITCVGLVAVLYAASRSFLLGGFVKLEQASARDNVQRVLNALDQDLAAVDRFPFDRAAADETYNFMGVLLRSLSSRCSVRIRQVHRRRVDLALSP
jgi:sensor domain CHASE-containing protein